MEAFMNTNNDVAITMQLVYIEVEKIANRMRKSGQSRRCLLEELPMLSFPFFYFSLSLSLSLSLSPPPLSLSLPFASFGWNLRHTSSIALLTGHVNPSNDSPRRKDYYLLRKNRGALKANLTAVYLLRIKMKLKGSTTASRRWERLYNNIYSSNVIILNLTIAWKKAKAKVAEWKANYTRKWEKERERGEGGERGGGAGEERKVERLRREHERCREWIVKPRRLWKI